MHWEFGGTVMITNDQLILKISWSNMGTADDVL